MQGFEGASSEKLQNYIKEILSVSLYFSGKIGLFGFFNGRQDCSPVIIVGPCGTGKTHIAQALGLCAIQQGADVLCTTQAELSEKLQAAKAINSYNRVLAAIAKIKLLIIDDFGLKPLKSPQD